MQHQGLFTASNYLFPSPERSGVVDYHRVRNTADAGNTSVDLCNEKPSPVVTLYGGVESIIRHSEHNIAGDM